MEGMKKGQIALSDQMVKELNAIEKETDRPRPRIIRRAIEEYLQRYRLEHPEFAKRFPRTLEQETAERELKRGLITDTVVVGGKKRTVIVEGDGWRNVREDDYIPIQMSVIDIPQTKEEEK